MAPRMEKKKQRETENRSGEMEEKISIFVLTIENGKEEETLT